MVNGDAEFWGFVLGCGVTGAFFYMLARFRYRPKSVHAVDLNEDGVEDIVVKTGVLKYGFIKDKGGKYQSIDNIKREGTRESIAEYNILERKVAQV